MTFNRGRNFTILNNLIRLSFETWIQAISDRSDDVNKNERKFLIVFANMMHM